MTTAYEEGFEARLCGQGRDLNPYKSDTRESAHWLGGWLDQDYHLKERDAALDSIGWFGR